MGDSDTSQGFTRWVKELLAALDGQIDEQARKNIMAACGQKCPFTHLTDSRLLDIRDRAETEEALLDTLCSEWRLQKQQGRYYVVFDRCYCPLVNDAIEGTSATLCSCTEGNLRHKFKLALGREVAIEVQKTIVRGDDECRFLIGIDQASSVAYGDER